mgnify:CR=1 FL=1
MGRCGIGRGRFGQKRIGYDIPLNNFFSVVSKLLHPSDQILISADNHAPLSGYYKYIVFDYQLKEETGKVFNKTDFGNEIEGIELELPNSYWVLKEYVIKATRIYFVPFLQGIRRLSKSATSNAAPSHP